MSENYYDDQTLSRFISAIMLVDEVKYDVACDIVRVAINEGFLIRERASKFSEPQMCTKCGGTGDAFDEEADDWVPGKCQKCSGWGEIHG